MTRDKLLAQIRPVGESSGSERLDKRSKITEAAAACFLRQGFAETSLDEIVAQSGVVKQTLYNYFENKEAIFKASIERLLAKTKTEFDIDWYKLAPAEFFQRVGKQLLLILAEQDTTAFLRLIVKECRRFPELQQIYAESIPQPLIDFVMGYIETRTKSALSANTRAALQGCCWYFRSALTGYATLANLAPLLKYSLPNKVKFLNVVAELFASYVEFAEKTGWDSIAASMPSGSTDLGCEAIHEGEIREFLNPQLANLGVKKLAIIEGAINVFSAKGFAEASMDDIAAAAGVSKQTVYKHFRNKNLMNSFIAKCVIDQLLLIPLPDPSLPILDYIGKYSAVFMSGAKQPWLREYVRFVFGESQIFPLESGAFLLYIMDHGREQLESKLKQEFGETNDSLSISILLRSVMGGFVLLSQIYVVGNYQSTSEESLQWFNSKLLSFQ